MNVLLKELKKFSKENWWIFLLLIVALIIVYITGKGNILEILILFLINFIGNLFIMVMQNNYTNGKNKIGAIYHIIATGMFSSIAIYGLIYLDQSQYIIWQIAYSLAAIKAFLYYNFNKDLVFLTEKTLIPLNIILLIIFINFFEYEGFHVLQAIGFSLITSGLVSINDKIRYWLNVVGIFTLASGSLLGVILSFNSGALDGIALGFFILTLTVFIYYLKLIKKYI